MDSKRTLDVTERDRALAVAVLTDARCACGQLAARVTVEWPHRKVTPRDRAFDPPFDVPSAWTRSKGRPSPVPVVRAWCGIVDGHDGLAQGTVDPDAVAMTEDDM